VVGRGAPSVRLVVKNGSNMSIKEKNISGAAMRPLETRGEKRDMSGMEAIDNKKNRKVLLEMRDAIGDIQRPGEEQMEMNSRGYRCCSR
jgi:hypothetical protein